MHRLGLLLSKQGAVIVHVEEERKDSHLGNQEQQEPHFFEQYHCAEADDL